MRVITSVLIATLLVAPLAVDHAVAQSDRKKAVTSGTVVMPKNSVLAPSKSAPPKTTAPRPTMVAPLTAAECTGLGGTVIKTLACAIEGGSQCVTVDQHGVVRRKCISAK